MYIKHRQALRKIVRGDLSLDKESMCNVLSSILVMIWYQLKDSYVRLIASILDGHQDNTNANIGIE